MLVSEVIFQIYVHELVPGPELQLRQLACIPSPEPYSEDKENHSVTAIWAPDGTAVLLDYMIRDYSDERAEFNANAYFEVQPSL